MKNSRKHPRNIILSIENYCEFAFEVMVTETNYLKHPPWVFFEAQVLKGKYPTDATIRSIAAPSINM